MPAPTIDFLNQSLATRRPNRTVTLPGVTATWLIQGALALEPTVPSALPAVIISVGVHGDEVVPIRLLNHWIAKWSLTGYPSHRPMLLVLANPLAVAAGTRFINHNMNRLFTAGSAEKNDPEARRVVDIMAAVQAFMHRHPEGLHFDLHSTIKPSERERFALVPASCVKRDQTELHHWFRRFGVDAWVQNRSEAATFSTFTGSLGYLSATIELGQVSSRGEPIDRFLPLVEEFSHLSHGLAEPSKHPCQRYDVVSEIIRPEGEFEVCLHDFVNFKPLVANTVIARGESRQWFAEQDGDAVLFLNAEVPPGHRVGLIIRPT